MTLISRPKAPLTLTPKKRFPALAISYRQLRDSEAAPRQVGSVPALLPTDIGELRQSRNIHISDNLDLVYARSCRPPD